MSVNTPPKIRTRIPDTSFRTFQAEDMAFFRTHPRSMCLYEPRLGKTVIGTALAIEEVHPLILVVCPKNAISVWRTHLQEWFRKWAPQVRLAIRIMIGHRDSRQILWAKTRTADVTVFIITYNAFVADFAWIQTNQKKCHLDFSYTISDESDRIRNRNSKAFTAFEYVSRHAKRTLMAIGTPMSKSPADFWTMLHICNRNLFGSFWRFADTFCDIEEHAYTHRKIILGPKNIVNFQRNLLMFARVRTRSECAQWMPKIAREIRPVTLNAEQAQLYEDITSDDFVFTESGQLVIAANSMERITRFRQILCCPKILGGATNGAAFDDFLEVLQEAPEEERHVVLFSGFRKAMPFFEAGLRQAGFENIFQLYGGLDPDELDKRIAAWRATKGIMICSVKYSQAFSLADAYECYFIAYDWDPNVNKQAEDRLIPQEGINPIMAYYYSYADTVDDTVVAQVNMKQQTITPIIKGSEQLMNEVGSKYTDTIWQDDGT